jgi:hypothetical protein
MATDLKTESSDDAQAASRDASTIEADLQRLEDLQEQVGVDCHVSNPDMAHTIVDR